MNTSSGIKDWRMPDKLWEKFKQLLPVHVNPDPKGRGRPRKPDRDCADAIFYVLRTGCQWKALDATRFVPGSTAHDRFQEWVKADVFKKLWASGLLAYDHEKGINWQWLSLDGAMTKAPLGGEKTGPNPTDRSKSGVKRSILTDGRGVPVGLAVGGANCPDYKLAQETIKSVPVKRPEPTKVRPQNICADKGYDYAEIDELLATFKFTIHIPRKGQPNQPLKRSIQKQARRYVVERTHSWMNRFRGILIRWNKKLENYLAMLHLALATIAFHASGLFG
jgi:transposase